MAGIFRQERERSRDALSDPGGPDLRRKERRVSLQFVFSEVASSPFFKAMKAFSSFFNRLTCVLTIFVGGATTRGADVAAPVPKPPIFEGTGAHKRMITGAQPETQRYFDQGVAFITSFNHDEGLRSMEYATQVDPECAMAWWGVALACSPHINNTGVPEARAKQAHEALARAEKFAGPCTPVEKALIRAMGVRFSDDPKAKRAPLDEVYRAAMREVWKAYPDDADIGAWTADAMMMLRPGDLWRKNGEAQPGTEEVLAVLEATLRLDPRQPLANHLSVHANEASSQPEHGDAAAAMLREITPGLGHMVHMSSHIDVRRGRWEDAIIANTRAIAANRNYREAAGHKLSGYLNYMGHDYHMLTYAAMMGGQGALAAQTMKDLFAQMPPEWERESETGDGYFAMHFDVMKRFGKWDEILAAPEPIERYTHARAWRWLARGIARAAQSDAVGARVEQQAFLAAKAKIPSKAVYRKNPLPDIMDIAALLLEGEILLREGKAESGFAALRDAVEREDKLRYAEPPAWAQPVRHALGAALLQRGRFDEAEQVYREDLKHTADNGWSLFGLAQVLRLQNKNADEAAALEARFKLVWAKADVKLTSSCFCQPGI
jgi:tetratricopeptide (TPR) repeat protein